MNTEPAIEVKGLRKSYKNVEVLADVDFTVPKGSIFSLLGANGAGKTTTINILTTLARADSGSARICGIDVQKNPAKVRELISLTGQFSAVDDLLSGRENLEMIGSLSMVDKKTVRERA